MNDDVDSSPLHLPLGITRQDAQSVKTRDELAQLLRSSLLRQKESQAQLETSSREVAALNLAYAAAISVETPEEVEKANRIREEAALLLSYARKHQLQVMLLDILLQGPA